jgi:hypothetical protein
MSNYCRGFGSGHLIPGRTRNSVHPTRRRFPILPQLLNNYGYVQAPTQSTAPTIDSCGVCIFVPQERIRASRIVERHARSPVDLIASSSNEYVTPEATRTLFSDAHEPKRLVMVTVRDHKYSGNVEGFFHCPSTGVGLDRAPATLIVLSLLPGHHAQYFGCRFQNHSPAISNL